MSFNTDQTKQTQEVISSRKTNICRHSSPDFNNTTVDQTPVQKYLGINLGSKLPLTEKNKAMKSIGLLLILPHELFLTNYKSFIRPPLDYGDVIFDQPSNDSFSKKIESDQHSNSRNYKYCLSRKVASRTRT